MQGTESKLKVLAQKADPNAIITKTTDGKGFMTSIINVMEDGTERPYMVQRTLKKKLVAALTKLPIENVRGMEIDVNSPYSGVTIDLFGTNSVY